MKCADSQELMQRWLDGDVISPDELGLHLAICTDCGLMFAAARQLKSGLRSVIPPKAPPLLTARIVTMVAADRRRRLLRNYAAAGLLAAACVLIAFLFFSLRPVQTPTPYAPMVVVAPQPRPVEQPEPPLRDTVKEGRQALDQLTNKVLAKVDEQTGVMGDALVPLQAAGLEFGAKSQPQTPTTKTGMSLGLQTVTATARRGLSFMFQAAPAPPDR
jgi:hypothetical protein